MRVTASSTVLGQVFFFSSNFAASSFVSFGGAGVGSANATTAMNPRNQRMWGFFIFFRRSVLFRLRIKPTFTFGVQGVNSNNPFFLNVRLVIVGFLSEEPTRKKTTSVRAACSSKPAVLGLISVRVDSWAKTDCPATRLLRPVASF
jgi:hypothetical protein